MSEKNQQNAGEFFESISSTYKKKYTPQQIFHYYFFTERLEKATCDLSFKNKKIIDLGAGTGDLYDYIYNIENSVDYFATDVSKGMLENSNIPSNKCFVGDYKSLDIKEDNFDFAFMLGVTTYLSQSELQGYLSFINKKLNNEKGVAVITFTNKYCLDNFSRSFLKPIISLIPNKNSVLAQNITINTYSLSDVRKIVGENFEIEEVNWLNHTIFPVNLIFKSLSVSVAKILDKIKNPWLISLLSSDFIVKVKPRKI